MSGFFVVQLEGALNRLCVISERTGEPIHITATRFRRTLGTRAAVEGHGELVIAELLDHTDTQNTGVSVQAVPAIVERIDRAMALHLAPLAQAFAGLIIEETELGFCVHDYTMSPCQLHRDCIHCEDLVCVKGEEEKTIRLRQNLDKARDLLRKAEDAVSDGYAGGDRWLEHHLSTVERLSQLCSIMDEPNVPHGAVVQLAPPRGVNRVSDSSRIALPPTQPMNPPAGLLAEILESMGG